MKTTDYIILVAIINILVGGYILGAMKGLAVVMIIMSIIVMILAPIYFEIRK